MLNTSKAKLFRLILLAATALMLLGAPTVSTAFAGDCPLPSGNTNC